MSRRSTLPTDGRPDDREPAHPAGPAPGPPRRQSRDDPDHRQGQAQGEEPPQRLPAVVGPAVVRAGRAQQPRLDDQGQPQQSPRPPRARPGPRRIAVAPSTRRRRTRAAACRSSPMPSITARDAATSPRRRSTSTRGASHVQGSASRQTAAMIPTPSTHAIRSARPIRTRNRPRPRARASIAVVETVRLGHRRAPAIGRPGTRSAPPYYKCTTIGRGGSTVTAVAHRVPSARARRGRRSGPWGRGGPRSGGGGCTWPAVRSGRPSRS